MRHFRNGGASCARQGTGLCLPGSNRRKRSGRSSVTGAPGLIRREIVRDKSPEIVVFSRSWRYIERSGRAAGEIGRHARLRILYRKMCGFKSRAAHQLPSFPMGFLSSIPIPCAGKNLHLTARICQIKVCARRSCASGECRCENDKPEKNRSVPLDIRRKRYYICPTK